MKTLIILGAGIMQIPAYELAKKQGWKTIAVDGDPSAYAVDMADLFWHIDLKDRLGITEKAREYSKENELHGVFTCGTDFSATTAWVSEQLELPGIPYQTALNATDKARMRQCFKDAGLAVPPFKEIHAEDYKQEMDLGLSFPLVVKPVDNMGSRGVKKVNHREELSEALNDAFKFSISNRAIVEGYLKGPEFSLDALIWDGNIEICGMADRVIEFPPYFVERGHHFPSEQSEEIIKQVKDCFLQGIDALGLNRGAAKGDVKFTPEGPVIGEIAARLSGGFMSGWTYPYASNRYPVLGAMKIALGESPGLSEEKELSGCAERASISIPGKIKEIRGLEKVYDSEGIKDIFLLRDEGERVTFPRSNVEKVANIIALGKDRDEAVTRAEEAAGNLDVILTPEDTETAVFLSSIHDWPGLAYHPLPLELMDRDDPDFKKITKGEIEQIHWLQGMDRSQKDWMERPMQSQIDRLISEYKIEFLEGDVSDTDLLFWYAFYKGGIQGARWYLDSVSS